MKKLIISMITIVMLFSFASCAKGGNVEDSSSKGDAMSTVESVVSSITGDVTSDVSDKESSNGTSSVNS